jgi:ankyrin repeat protein
MAEWSEIRGAVEMQDAALLRACISRGDDINAVNPVDGFSLLHHAIDTEADGARQDQAPRIPSETSRILIEAGIDVDVRNRAGETALDLARWWGHLEVVRLLEARAGLPNREAEP